MKLRYYVIVLSAIVALWSCQNPADLAVQGQASARSVASVGQTIWLKAQANSSFVSADQGLANTPLVANRAAASGWEYFQIVDAGGGSVALKASNGNYVCADLNLGASAPLVANRTTVGTWEKFQLVDAGSNGMQLRALATGKFVCADLNRNSTLVADRSSASTWETFAWGTAVSPSPTPPAGWRLVWSDEFNASGAVDSSKWVYDLGGGGWGNAEWEVYTNSTANVYQDGGGNLVIKAINTNGSYTSGRIKTLGKFEFTYGKVEMRAKLPFGQGIWPAFWMLGSSGGQWPNNGEIDIMENIGKASEQTKVYGTIHGPGYSGAGGIGAVYNGPRFADAFHTFSIEWEPNVIRWYVDGNLYETRTPADLGSNTWVFNHNFYLLLNLAVGGAWPGYPDASTVFPQSYTIDYVRVYQR